MFKFRAEFWDSDENVTKFENGITEGATYGDAANHVVDYYGRDNIIALKLEELDVVLLDEDCENLFKSERIDDNE